MNLSALTRGAQIMAQIKRRFPDHPPCRCTAGGKNSSRGDALVMGGDAMETVANVVGAFIG